MQLSVLGAGPAYTNRVGATGAAYLLRNGDQSLLLDLGQGSFPALARAIEPSRLTGIFVSHLHPDHFIDLVPLRHYLRYEFTPPPRLTVHAPAGLADRLDALHREPGFCSVVLDVHDVEPGTRRVGDFDIESRRVTHTENSFAFRVSAGAVGVVYSGDCGRWQDLVPLVREGDTLLTEVSFGTAAVPPGAFHLNADAVVELVRVTRPGRVLLTHIQMGFDRDATVRAVKAAFPGPVELVDPGLDTTI